METYIYKCDGFRAIRAKEDEGIDPARILAERAARREYGRRGCVAALRLDSWTQDGRCSTYEAFIGRPATDGNGIAGHNIWLTIITERINN